MIVFDTYRFNIADKVKFKDTQPYLKNMLAELGLNWSDLAFSVSAVPRDSVIAKALEKYPKLENTTIPQKTVRRYAVILKTGSPGNFSPINQTTMMYLRCSQRYPAR